MSLLHVLVCVLCVLALTAEVCQVLEHRASEVVELDLSCNSRMRDAGPLALCPAIANRSLYVCLYVCLHVSLYARCWASNPLPSHCQQVLICALMCVLMRALICVLICALICVLICALICVLVRVLYVRAAVIKNRTKPPT